jgi:ATP-binding cassette subfamily B protein
MTGETKRTGEIRKGLRAVLRHVRSFKRELIIIVALGIISALANGAIPYITGRFFDALIDVSKGTAIAPGALPLWVGLLIAWTIIELVANNTDWVMERLRREVDTKIHFNIQVSGFAHMLRLPLSYHKRAHINGEIQKLSNASWRVSAIVRTVIDFGPQFLSIFIGATLAATINTTLASVLLAGVVLYILLSARILRPLAAIDADAHRTWNSAWDEAAARVQQVESVKQAAAEELETEKIRDSLLNHSFNLWMKIERAWNNVGFFQRTLVFFTQLAIFILSVHFVSSGTITVGELVALNGYALMFFGPFVALGYNWQVIQNGIISAAHAEEIFEEKEEVYIPKNVHTPSRFLGHITFHGVSFQYGPGQNEILSGVNIDIAPGETVALVGESGVGKSTSTSLIAGYYFPTEGSVMIDGVDTRELNLTYLREHIAVVPQEIALFNDTILYNIKYGTPDASEEEVIHAAQQAHLDELIQRLPQKYQTMVGDRGVKLSVGQKQRIAIARAILRNPAILILDEPTSALDARTEQLIGETLEQFMRGRTTIIVAHRLSTVRKANKIIVFEKGKIAEIGTHDELVKREGGVYRRLYEYQIGLH